MGACVNYLLRVDDFGWTAEEGDRPPTKKADVGLRLARQFHEVLDGMPYLAGVIPACVDLEGVEWLEGEPVNMTKALHGFTHEDRGDRHEFEGMSPAIVRDKIAEGHRIIGPTPYYIPPFNSLDHAHIPSLWHEGIRYIFGREQQWETPPSPTELAMGVRFIPAWARLYGALGWQQGAASRRLLDEMELTHDKDGLAVMTLHLPWEFARDPRLQHLRELRRTWKRKFVSAAEFVGELK
jgi:hypothetical protein